jgi:hypothetical protein
MPRLVDSAGACFEEAARGFEAVGLHERAERKTSCKRRKTSRGLIGVMDTTGALKHHSSDNGLW